MREGKRSPEMPETALVRQVPPPSPLFCRQCFYATLNRRISSFYFFLSFFSILINGHQYFVGGRECFSSRSLSPLSYAPRSVQWHRSWSEPRTSISDGSMKLQFLTDGLLQITEPGHNCCLLVAVQILCLLAVIMAWIRVSTCTRIGDSSTVRRIRRDIKAVLVAPIMYYINAI